MGFFWGEGGKLGSRDVSQVRSFRIRLASAKK